MDFNLKVKIWQRVTIDDKELSQKLLSKLKVGTIKDILEFFNALAEEWYADEQTTVLFETEELIYPEENNGVETVDVYGGNQLLWNNKEIKNV